MAKLIRFKDFSAAYDTNAWPENDFGLVNWIDIRNTLFNEEDFSSEDGANILPRGKKPKKTKDPTPQGPYNRNNLGGEIISLNGGTQE